MPDASPITKRGFAEPGSIIAGKYRVERQIGKGGMGCIVAARHLQLDELVALKFLLAPEERVDEFQERFLREARITAKLRSAHVARTLDFGVTDGGDPFMVMEYLEGITLQRLLRESGPLPLEVAVNYGLQICEGLAEAHRLRVIHRDLKPANLFLMKGLDGSDLLKILDFGVSKLRNFAAAQSDLTAAGMLIGSPKYMAIEQLTNAGDVDERADIWSLGAIVYEMLAGKPPFPGSNTTQVCVAIMQGEDPPSIREGRPEVPEALDQAVLRCLSRDIDQRTPNVGVLARALADGSGMEGAQSLARAVEDVLVLPTVAMGATGQLRAFGQSGSYPSASGSHRPSGGASTSQSSPPTSALLEKTVAEHPVKSKRSTMFAVAGLILFAGVVAFATRTGAESEQAIVTSAAIAPPSFGSSGTPPASSETREVDSPPTPTRTEESPVDGGRQDSGKPEAGPPIRPTGGRSPVRPLPAEKTATPRIASTKRPPSVSNPDPFGSRY